MNVCPLERYLDRIFDENLMVTPNFSMPSVTNLSEKCESPERLKINYVYNAVCLLEVNIGLLLARRPDVSAAQT